MIRKDGQQHRIINLMIQLQELYVAKAQQVTVRPGSRLTQLNDAIKGLAEQLPTQHKSTYIKLLKKSSLAIVPISVSSCSACGMVLPASLINTVKIADILNRCPSCARFLYFPEGLPRRISSQNRSRSELIQGGIERFTTSSLMIPHLKSSSGEEVVSEICNVLKKENFIDNEKRLAEETMKREAVMSTAMENALAFPHVRGVEGGGLTLAVASHRKGVSFGAPGKKLTRLFFFMTIPTSASVFYLKLLSGLSQVFREKEARKIIMAATTSENMWEILLKLTKDIIR